MPSSTSPNMGLVVPTVGQEPGPDWANDINADLGVLDQHDHSSGKGVPVTPSGMNISSDLPFNGNNATLVKTINFQAQSASLSGVAPNLGCIYVAGNELYYNDEAGNVVQITNLGSVNAGAGSISGLPSGTASASYSGGTFIWQSATNTPANTDTGSVILRNATASSKGLTLNPPTAMAADIAETLPTVPAATSFMTMDASGNMGTSIPIAGGIVNSNIADNTITYQKLSSSSFNSPALLASVGKSNTYTGSGSYTVPAGVTQLYIIACGGGGGGGGGGRASMASLSGGISGGGGGAGTDVWEGVVTVVAGNTYSITIGSGGGGGGTGGVPSNGGTGSAGGDTTFGSLLLAPGGAGGSGGQSSGTGGSGGAGRVRAGNTGGAGASSAQGGASYLKGVNAGSGGTGATGTTGAGGGFGAGGGGSYGGGGNVGANAVANTGGGGGGGNGGTTSNAASSGGTGGSGIMIINIL